MASHTIKVSGISAELLRLLDERVRTQHATGRAEYVRELIRRDVISATEPPAKSWREIIAPVHAEAAKYPYSEDELDRDIEEAREEYRRSRTAQQA